MIQITQAEEEHKRGHSDLEVNPEKEETAILRKGTQQLGEDQIQEKTDKTIDKQNHLKDTEVSQTQTHQETEAKQEQQETETMKHQEH